MVATVALLVLAPSAALLAQEASTEPIASEEMEATLTGQLAGSAESGYTLTESESGDQVTLQGEADFASYVDTTVTVHGKWANDADGNRYFEVSSIEAAAEPAPEAEG
ncbi:MAG: hypothetical protein ACRD0X_04410 [Thermoanaerobaculia bacterium]